MASSTTYSSKIIATSAEFSVKERLKMKDTTDAIRLDKATEVSPIFITPTAWAVIQIHNEKSDSKDYYNYVVLDAGGDKYVTGSQSFWNAFEELNNEMMTEGMDILGTEIKVFRHESRNYADKYFLTCSIA